MQPKYIHDILDYQYCLDGFEDLSRDKQYTIIKGYILDSIDNCIDTLAQLKKSEEDISTWNRYLSSYTSVFLSLQNDETRESFLKEYHPKKLKVLVACEESQRVTIELRKQGHEAYSCDIQPCSGGYPEYHIQGDALKEAYSGKYDMIIGFPPCTYLSKASAVRLFPNRILNEERYKKGLEAKDFFMKLYNAPVKYVAIENPTPLRIFDLPKETQAIQPHEHGHPYTKRTCLWLRNLPTLQPTKKVNAIGSWVSINRNKKTRSKTFQGIAKAMSIQWSSWVKLDTQTEGV